MQARRLVARWIVATAALATFAASCGSPPSPAPPVRVLQVAQGDVHSCAVLSNGTVKCWGRNNSGQLGAAGMIEEGDVVAVEGVSGAVQVEAGDFHSCALVRGGRVKCWGGNDNGQLGNGTTASSSSPVDVIGIEGATEVVAGSLHTCALLGDGTVRCWGWGIYGVLGTGDGANSPVPGTVVGLSDAVDLAAGATHNCAVTLARTVKCWGNGADGQMGNGTTTQVNPYPVDATGLADVVQVSAGTKHTCALRDTRTVECWGDNSSGQLGNGTQDSTSTPSPVLRIPDAVEISANGLWHSCTRRTGGKVSCWGLATNGLLGDGGIPRIATEPVDALITDAQQLSLGTRGACAVVIDGGVKCWGYTGLTVHEIPTKVSGLP